MTFTVVTPAYTTDETSWRLLRESCARNNIPVSRYGKGVNWPGWAEGKIGELANHLATLDADVVLVTDAYDTFVTPSIANVVEEFKYFDTPIMISGEKNCYPNAELASVYPLWCSVCPYVNSGGFIGGRRAIMKALRRIARTTPDDDQEGWTRYYLDRYYESCAYPRTCSGKSIIIDYDCCIFQTMASAENDVELRKGRFYNRKTLTYPAVIHFNGRSGGIQAWYDLVYEEVA